MAATIEARPCRHGIACFQLDSCAFAHPPEWHTNRCPDGAACRSADCPQVHPKRVGPCVNGIACFNLGGCGFLHPAAWYTDRCPQGAACQFTDCPQVHPRRASLACPHGLDCRRPQERCALLHPRAWYQRPAADAAADAAAGAGLPEQIVPVSPEATKMLRQGSLLQVCRVAAAEGVTAHLVGNQLVLRGERAGEAAVVDAVQLLVANLVSRLPDDSVREENIEMQQAKVGRLIGAHGQLIRMMQRDLGVTMRFEGTDRENPDAIVNLIISGPKKVLDGAMDRVYAFCVDPSPQELQLRAEAQDTVDIFLDNSNLLICGQNTPDGGRNFRVRLNIRGLVQAMQGARQVRRRVVVGSKPPQDHSIWRKWSDAPPAGAGFEVRLSFRDPETNREQNVDEFLVAQALMHAANHEPGVMVLGTGDGNLLGQREGTLSANFRNLVSTAVTRFHWRVELWCWRQGCHSWYKTMAEDPAFGGRLKICYLDGLRSQVTFESGGGRGAAPAAAGPAAAAAAAPAVPVEPQEEEEELCAVCMEEPATHCYRPCNHRVLCATHAAEILPHREVHEDFLADCILCRTRWSAIERAA